MNKIYNKIISLFNKKNESITHTIVTTSGTKIKCCDSVELFSDETKIIVAKCLVNRKYNIITINDDKIDYILENYNDDIWNQLLNMNITEITEIEDDRLYS